MESTIDIETKIKREQAVIGSMLRFPDKCLKKGLARLQEKCYSDLNCRDIHRALNLLDKEGIPVDLVTVKEKLGDRVLGSLLSDLYNSVISPEAANFDFHLSELAADEKAGIADLFSRAMPSSGLLLDYHQYIDQTTDACREFKYFAGMFILSTVIGRKRYLPWGLKNVYPNLYGVLTAESTEGRKSSLLSAVKSMLHKVDPDLNFYDSYSPEAFYLGLAEKPQRIITQDEFSKVLAESKAKGYMAGWRQDLTSFYGCPDQYKKKLAQTSYIVEFPYIVFLACTTFPWLLENITETDLRSGFLARFSLIPSSPKVKILPCPPSPDEEKRAYLIACLNEIYTSDFLEMQLTPEARTLYEAYYIDSDRALRREPNRELIAPFFLRLVEENCLKFAILYTVSENPLGNQISPDNMQLAINLCQYFKTTLREMFLKDFIFSEGVREKEKVLKMIRESVAIPHSKLLQNSHLKGGAKDLKEIIQTLLEEGRISIIGEGRGKQYEAAYDE